MRPINRGGAPQVFTDYKDAKPFLADRLGTYCSFCERRIPTNLAVEHILPKDPALGHAHLRNDWNNFLLACVNCNSSKGTTVLTFANYILPDRDNSFVSFEYLDDGDVEAIGDANTKAMAQNTLDMVSLNKCEHPSWNEKLQYSALERASQRVEAWVTAKKVRGYFDNGQTNIEIIALLAAASGFFSIWMKAFNNRPEVRRALIEAFGATAEDCFDADTNPVTPRPANGLTNCGKV